MSRNFQAAALSLLLPLLLACGGDSPGEERSEARQAPPVEAVEARSGSLPLEERLSGVVKASNQVIIRPEIEAAVVEVLVESGERVAEGQPLVRLDDRTLRDQLRQSEASVRLAEAQAREARARVAELEAQVSRWRSLAEDEVVSRLDLETLEARVDGAAASADQSDARVEQARATADERRSALADTLVRSPVDGRVGRRNAELGMLVDPATELFVVGNFDRVKVEVPLTEAMLGRLREGLPVTLRADSLEEPIEGELSRISPFLTEGSFSTVGEIDLENPAGTLRPGMFVTARVRYGDSQEATLVPSSAVWEDPRSGERVIFVVDPAGGAPGAELGEEARPVERRPVDILAEGRATVGVGGVEPGEWVVTVGQQLLEGEKLEARVRAASWQRLLELQDLQQEDLLEEFMAKQQRLAQSVGVEPPSSDAFAEAARDEAGQRTRDAERAGGSGATTPSTPSTPAD